MSVSGNEHSFVVLWPCHASIICWTCVVCSAASCLPTMMAATVLLLMVQGFRGFGVSGFRVLGFRGLGFRGLGFRV